LTRVGGMTRREPPVKDDDLQHDTPPVVIGSIAAGVAPLPFLGVYAVLFIAHGFIYPVQPPDITSSQGGEGVAGIIAAVLFVVLILMIWWFLDGRRRWPFVIGQLAVFITSLDFLLDSTKGSPAVPVVLVLTSATALVLAFLAPSWAHVASTRPARRKRPATPKRPSQHGEQTARSEAPAEASADVSA
jgi:sterol desaturase/sphingolipid hydroxylase (fatty acid hydroxylase superfamily)